MMLFYGKFEDLFSFFGRIIKKCFGAKCLVMWRNISAFHLKTLSWVFSDNKGFGFIFCSGENLDWKSHFAQQEINFVVQRSRRVFLFLVYQNFPRNQTQTVAKDKHDISRRLSTISMTHNRIIVLIDNLNIVGRSKSRTKSVISRLLRLTSKQVIWYKWTASWSHGKLPIRERMMLLKGSMWSHRKAFVDIYFYWYDDDYIVRGHYFFVIQLTFILSCWIIFLEFRPKNSLPNCLPRNRS